MLCGITPHPPRTDPRGSAPSPQTPPHASSGVILPERHNIFCPRRIFWRKLGVSRRFLPCLYLSFPLLPVNSHGIPYPSDEGWAKGAEDPTAKGSFIQAPPFIR